MGMNDCHLMNDNVCRDSDGGFMPRVHFGTAHHIASIAAPMIAVAELAAHGARKLRRSRRLDPRGAILHPGPDTPRWNALAKSVA